MNPAPQPRTPEFEPFLFGGKRPAAVGMDDVQLETRAVGLVDLPDGRVYACDPLVPMDSQPLAHRLQCGRYLVVLFVVTGTEHGRPEARTECNAAAALLCSDKTPVRWELAAREGGPSNGAAYGVDSGTGGFMGHLAIEEALNGDDPLGQAIMSALRDASGAVVSIADGVSAAAFRSGIGDGTYETWLGHDAQGQLAIILTDFQVVDSEDYVSRVHAQWAVRNAQKWWQFWR